MGRPKRKAAEGAYAVVEQVRPKTRRGSARQPGTKANSRPASAPGVNTQGPPQDGASGVNTPQAQQDPTPEGLSQARNVPSTNQRAIEMSEADFISRVAEVVVQQIQPTLLEIVAGRQTNSDMQVPL